MLKKTIAILFGFAFLFFAFLQYNDPDPELWMAVYGIAAALSFAAAFNRVSHSLLWIAATVYLAAGIYVWPENYEGLSVGGGDIKNIEEARESLGLFLCTVVFVGYVIFDKLRSKAHKTAGIQ